MAELDPEVAACSAVLQALTPLDPLARQRVLDWATARLIPGGADPMALVTATVAMVQSFADDLLEHKKQNPNPSEADKKLYGSVPAVGAAVLPKEG
jgi:hypothetical protein